jgi:hypothetical protein
MRENEKRKIKEKHQSAGYAFFLQAYYSQITFTI